MKLQAEDFEAAGCQGKKTYSFARAKNLARDVGRRHDEPMQHYHCTFCKGWHIGRPKRSKRMRKMAAESIET